MWLRASLAAFAGSCIALGCSTQEVDTLSSGGADAGPVSRGRPSVDGGAFDLGASDLGASDLGVTDGGLSVDDVGPSPFDPTRHVDCPPGGGAFASTSVELRTRRLQTSVGDFLALCEDWIVYGDRTRNRVVLERFGAAGPTRIWQMPSTPGRMARLAGSAQIFVALEDADALAVVDLSTEAVRTASISGPAQDLAVSPQGQVFVSLRTGEISVLDARSLTSLGTRRLQRPFDLVAVDPSGRRVFVANRGISPSTMVRMGFDPSSAELSVEQESEHGALGSNGQDLEISPDGLSILFPNGGGNGPGYTITEFRADSFARNGSFDTGPYPRFATWRPDGRFVIATNGFAIFVFDASTKVPLGEFSARANCSYESIRKVLFSRSGEYFYGLSDCGFRDEGALFYMGGPRR